jgi:hypothetical protein
MPQGQATWDYRNMVWEPSVGFRLYTLFLVIVCITAAGKLFKVWRAAPPFRLHFKASCATYIRDLKTCSSSLQQWIGLTFLGWGIFSSLELIDISSHFLEQGIVRGAGVLLLMANYATALSMALFVVLFLYISRWHMIKRIEWLQKRLAEATQARTGAE